MVSKSLLEKLMVGGVAVAFFVFAFSFFVLLPNACQGGASGAVASPGVSAAPASTQDNSFLPKGVPGVYGAELGVSYDSVSASDPKAADATIRKLGALDNSIVLDSSQMERYKKVASQISCEYCCDVDAIIFADGSAACGCAHSFAMRGLAKYIIKNHPADFSDDGILEELSKWKVLFFPSQSSAKAARLDAKGIEGTYINVASNKYRGE